VLSWHLVGALASQIGVSAWPQGRVKQTPKRCQQNEAFCFPFDVDRLAIVGG
jgi:hypothetical protein